MQPKVKYMIDVKSGKGYSSYVKEFNNDRHFENWMAKFGYKVIGATKIK